MIKIKGSGDGGQEVTATVSDFTDAIGYCEYKIPFQLAGIRAPPSAETISGSKAHKEEEKYEMEHVELEPITPEQLSDMKQDVEFARETVLTKYQQTVATGKGGKTVTLSLFGRSDKMLRSDSRLLVQDDKFPADPQKYAERFEPYPNQMLQTLTYLNSRFSDDGTYSPDEWIDIPHAEKSWIIQIKDRGNGNRPFKIFRGTQTEETRLFLERSAQRFALLALGSLDMMHHNSAKRCAPCRYFSQCDARIQNE